MTSYFLSKIFKHPVLQNTQFYYKRPMFKFDCEKYILYNLDHLFPDKITEQAFILTLNFRLAAYFKQCFCKVFPELNIHEKGLMKSLDYPLIANARSIYKNHRWR